MNEELGMLRLCFMFALCTLLFLLGCGSPSAASRDIVQAYGELAEAHWDLEQRQGYTAFTGIPVLEKQLIAYGHAADTEAMKLTRNFDHRIRCSGLTVILSIRGRVGARDVLVDHLTDPHEPIRWFCWHELRALGVIDLRTMPSDIDHLAEWRQLKSTLSDHTNEQAEACTPHDGADLSESGVSRHR
ncbi:MAG: hypothetical protein GXY38_02130 [Planctomycetes bacterium]|nr:hypothetical protein [Planctomycetota bacterium]